jgi:BlaI family transcriptional regulator, penicillinase repressor
MARIPHLTAAEFEILKVLWRLEHATVAEVRANQQRDGAAPAYTTVMTLLGRLAAKGAVLVDRSREPFVYRAAHRRESVIGSRVRAFVEDVFDGKADSLVLHLVEDSALSRDDLRAIERILAKATAAEEAPRPAPRRGRRNGEGGRGS